jgi:hypothetical protein
MENSLRYGKSYKKSVHNIDHTIYWNLKLLLYCSKKFHIRSSQHRTIIFDRVSFALCLARSTIGDRKNAFYGENLKGRDNLGDTGVDERHVKWILQEERMVKSSGFIWHKIRSSGKLLWTWQCTFNVHKLQKSSSRAQSLSDSHEEPRSMKCLSYKSLSPNVTNYD